MLNYAREASARRTSSAKELIDLTGSGSGAVQWVRDYRGLARSPAA